MNTKHFNIIYTYIKIDYLFRINEYQYKGLKKVYNEKIYKNSDMQCAEICLINTMYQHQQCGVCEPM